MNRLFDVSKNPVYRFDLCERYQIVWIDIALWNNVDDVCIDNASLYAKFEVRSSLRVLAILYEEGIITLLTVIII